MIRTVLFALLILTASPAVSQQNGAIPNEICSEAPRGADKLDLRRIGPLLEGSWIETAVGIGATMGVQEPERATRYCGRQSILAGRCGGTGAATTDVAEWKRKRTA